MNLLNPPAYPKMYAQTYCQTVTLTFACPQTLTISLYWQHQKIGQVCLMQCKHYCSLMCHGLGGTQSLMRYCSKSDRVL